LSALDKNKYLKARGENVEAKIMKIEKLLYNLEETLVGSGAGTMHPDD